jgi:glycosyltransferase involved in cell wall biosynthesis
MSISGTDHMNILLITNRYPRDEDDPASPFVPDFVEALRQEGVRVIVSTPQYGPPSPNGDTEVHRFRFGCTADETPIGSWDLRSPQTWWKIHRFVAAGERAAQELASRLPIDHILALWALPSGWFARQVARRREIPYSVWCLGSDIHCWARRPIFGRITKRILQRAALIFADGLALSRAARRFSGQPCRFLPSCRWLPRMDLSGPEPQAQRPYFLYTGRLHRAKGIYDLLSAYRHTELARAGFDLVFVGDGSEEARMREVIGACGLGEHVRLVGQVSRRELVDYYRGARAVVIPSYADSLPLVFSEALQAKAPLIAYNTGDLGLFIRRFALGRVVPTGDIVSLGEALRDFSVTKKQQPERAQAGLALLAPRRAARKFLQAIQAINCRPATARSTSEWRRSKTGVS